MSKRDLAPLSVRAEPGVSITVLDAELKPVASDVGTLQAELPTGLYELQLVAGHAVSRLVLRLESTGTSFDAPAVDFPSPAPLSRNELDDVVSAEASRRSKRPSRRLGRGAQLLVVVADAARVARANAASALTLRTLGGELVADLEELSARSAAGARPVWSISCLELDPGPYVLRVSTGHATVEQSVILVGGWQTQVFLDRKSWRPAPTRRRASLPDASVLMARTEEGFDARRPDLRLTELARIALLDRRTILGWHDIVALVDGKWDNPMLGLYGANLLLCTGARSIEELTNVRGNLRWLLGDHHPDVAALDVRADEPIEPLTVPPMLRVSWDALVAGTAARPELIPAGSLPGRIANHLFGVGVWLTWQAKARRAEAPSEPVEPGLLAERIDQLAAAVSRPRTKRGRRSRARRTADLSPVSQSVVALAQGLARDEQSGKRPKLSDRDVVEALGAPQAVVANALDDALGSFRATTKRA
jgi:hypothetical protein